MSDLTKTEARAPGQHGHLGWALVLISIAQLMVVLDATIANIALPYIGRDLDICQANLSWIVTGYALAFGGLLLLGGRLGDLYGRRRIFMYGLIIFAVASLLGGLAQNEGLLLGARGLQGLGAALASPAALALITTTFPAGPQRNRAFAVYAAMSGAGAAVGLILGGWLTGLDGIAGMDFSGWRLTFLINVPIGLAAAFIAPRLLAESESHHGELDIPGALTGTLGLLGIVFGLTQAGKADYGWDHPSSYVSLIVGVALLGLFAFIESRVEHPLLPMRILKNRTRAASFIAMMLAPAAMFAMFFFLSLFIQQIVGYSPLQCRVRVPAVLVRHRDRGRAGVQPGQPDRPALPRRVRHPARVVLAVHVLEALGRRLPGRRRGRTGPRQHRRHRRELLDVDPARGWSPCPSAWA